MTWRSSGLEPSTAPEMSLLPLDPAGPRVVAVGGGHGLEACLQAVQTYASEITAVVSVADDGGSSGRLSNELGIPPPGDLRRCLLALSAEPSLWAELLAYRFGGSSDEAEEGLAGHSLGNLILAALTDLTGSFSRALRQAESLLGAVGRVLPVSERRVLLSAVVGGRPVEGQKAIAAARGGIESLRVGPDGVEAAPDALEAIAGADQIILGPGSLFTSVLAPLLVGGMVPTLNGASGRLVLVLNLVTQDGETLGLSGRQHLASFLRLSELQRSGGIVAHDGPIDVPPGLEAVRLARDEAADFGWDVHAGDVADPQASWPAHDPIRLGRALSTLV